MLWVIRVKVNMTIRTACFASGHIVSTGAAVWGPRRVVGTGGLSGYTPPKTPGRGPQGGSGKNQDSLGKLSLRRAVKSPPGRVYTISIQGVFRGFLGGLEGGIESVPED